MTTPFHKERLRGNVKIFAALSLFSIGVYAYSMYKMGMNDFKDINDFGKQIEEQPLDHKVLVRRPRGSGEQQQ